MIAAVDQPQTQYLRWQGCQEGSLPCRGVVAMRSGSPQLAQFLGREMLRGAFAAVAGAGPHQQAELLHLARDILAMDSPFPAAPREVDMLRCCLPACLPACLALTLAHFGPGHETGRCVLPCDGPDRLLLRLCWPSQPGPSARHASAVLGPDASFCCGRTSQ